MFLPSALVPEGAEFRSMSKSSSSSLCFDESVAKGTKACDEPWDQADSKTKPIRKTWHKRP